MTKIHVHTLIILIIVLENLKDQKHQLTLDIAKYREIQKSLEKKRNSLNTLCTAVSRIKVRTVSVPLSRYLSLDSGPFVREIEELEDEAPNETENRKKKKAKK